MKKLAFAFAAIVAVSFASCGNKAQQAEEAQDSCCADSACCEVACDSACCGDSCAAACCDSTVVAD